MHGGAKLSRTDAIISQSIDDLFIPGVVIEVDPDEADRLGAFAESALSDDDAWESNIDL